VAEDRIQTGEIDPDATAPLPESAADNTLLCSDFLLDDGLLPSSLDPEAGERIAQRYTLRRRIGQGGFGDVWEADTADGQPPVAIKLIPVLSQAALGRVRREVAALRWARLPGVVRMLDDGTHQGDYFIAMDLVKGHAFPGQPNPVPWDRLRPVVLSLLEVLARVHLAGIIHCDLKPQNVLVDAEGRPTVLDLGIAAGRALRSTPRDSAHTPRYAPPEQASRTAAPDERSDLYAAAMMIYEALTGDVPRAPPACRHPNVPAPVADVLERMLAPEPGDRYPSALEVIAALGGQLPPLLGGGGLDTLPTGRPSTPEELRDLFHGPDLFLHLREDAAGELWRRTGGHRTAIEEELGAWLRAGVAHWDEHAIRIDRAGIERLQSGLRLCVRTTPHDLEPEAARILDWIELCWPHTDRPTLVEATGSTDIEPTLSTLRECSLIWDLPDGRVGCRPYVAPAQHWTRQQRRDAQRHLLGVLPSTSDAWLWCLMEVEPQTQRVVDALLHAAQQRIKAGQLKESVQVLSRALSFAQAEVGLVDSTCIMRQWAYWALSQFNKSSINHALYLFESTLRPESLKPTETLLRAAQAGLNRTPDRAHQIESSIPPVREPEFNRWRNVVRVYISTRHKKQDTSEVLQSLEQWSTQSPINRSLFEDWKGLLAYQNADYAESARHHSTAASLKISRSSKVSSLLNGANAMMEALSPHRALQIATEARQLARASRLTKYEIQSYWLIRTCHYRLCHKLSSDPHLLETVRKLPGFGLFALTEAAIKWRDGDTPGAASLLQEARRHLSHHQGIFTVDAMQMYLSGVYTPSVADDVCRMASESEIPDLVVQSLAAVLFFKPDHRCRELFLRSVDSRPERHRSARLDFFSYNEALQIAQGARL